MSVTFITSISFPLTSTRTVTRNDAMAFILTRRYADCCKPVIKYATIIIVVAKFYSCLPSSQCSPSQPVVQWQTPGCTHSPPFPHGGVHPAESKIRERAIHVKYTESNTWTLVSVGLYEMNGSKLLLHSYVLHI